MLQDRYTFSVSFLGPRYKSRLQEQPTSPRHATRPCTLLPGERPLLLMITPRHHCTRLHTGLALSHESEWPAVVEVGLETARCRDLQLHDSSHGHRHRRLSTHYPHSPRCCGLRDRRLSHPPPLPSDQPPSHVSPSPDPHYGCTACATRAATRLSHLSTLSHPSSLATLASPSTSSTLPLAPSRCCGPRAFSHPTLLVLGRNNDSKSTTSNNDEGVLRDTAP